jgi:hypothetical protein
MSRLLASSPLILALATCSSAMSPSQPGSATIVISADGMTPKEVSINRGNRVIVENRDSHPHRPMSGPHPEHTSCPALNFDSIPPGAKVQSPVLDDALDCRLHDEMNVGDASFSARVLVGLQ